MEISEQFVRKFTPITPTPITPTGIKFPLRRQKILPIIPTYLLIIYLHKHGNFRAICSRIYSHYQNYLRSFHKTKRTLLKLPSKFSQNKANRRLMANANDKFNAYRESLKHGVEEEITDALNTYYQARKRLHGTVLNAEHKRWTAAIVGNDSKKLWSMINWDGNMVNKPLTTQPPISCIKDHFEELYTPEDPLELVKIQDLYTNVNIPILDNPITEAELIDTMKDCKKGGYDYCLPVLNILTKHLLPVILLLFNMIFYITYPVNLACSLLITIPKTGNLKLPKNFRGIQMLPALGVLYDRIITKTSRKMDIRS